AHARRGFIEDDLWRVLELDDDFGASRSETLARTHVEGNAVPAPRVYAKSQGRVGWYRGVDRDARLIAIAVELSGYHVVGGHRPHVLQHLGLLISNGFRIDAGWRFHRQVAHHLQ